MSIQHTSETVDFDAAVAAWVAEYKDLKAQIEHLTERADVARAHIEAALGDATLGFFNNKPVVRWTVVTSNRLDTKRVRELLPPQVIEALTTVTTSRRFEIVKDGD